MKNILLALLMISGYIGKASTFIYQDTTIKICNINLEDFRYILQNSNKKFKFIIIITNYCRGTAPAIKEYNEYIDGYTNQVDGFLISSAPLKDLKGLVRVLHQNGFKGTAYIIGKPFKDKWPDDRKKGTKFRNMLAPECQSDVIGVPYRMLYKNDSLVMHGYPGLFDLKNIPQDFLKYFLEKE